MLEKKEQNLKNIAWAGLGNFGLPMALRLKDKGYNVTGLAFGGKGKRGGERLKVSGGEFLTDCNKTDMSSFDILCLCLPTSKDVEEVINMYTTYLPPIIFDFTTGCPKTTRAIASKLRQYDKVFIDVPVSGSKNGAREGELTLFIGANESQLAEHAKNILNTIGKNLFYFNEVSMGHSAKLVNQLVHLANVCIIKEGLNLANHLGLNPEKVVESVKKASGNSVMLERFGLDIISNEYTAQFALSMAFKDLNIIDNLLADCADGYEHFREVRKLFYKYIESGYGNANFTVVCKNI